jgi:acyl-coenzyme A thioesterase PaaI-like protein
VNALESAGAVESVIEVEPHNCFACGALNEHGLHLDLHVAADRCWTELTLTDAFQGWDGIAHGGIVTTILDEVMAWSLAATDNWGVTAHIAVAFKKPVPIGSPIRAEGWISENRRRLIETGARIVDADGAVLATADATYVAAGPERKRELQSRYRFRMSPVSGSGRGTSPTATPQAGTPPTGTPPTRAATPR